MYSNPPMDYLYHTHSYHPWNIFPTYSTNPSFTTSTTPSFPSHFPNTSPFVTTSQNFSYSHGYTPHQQPPPTFQHPQHYNHHNLFPPPQAWNPQPSQNPHFYTLPTFNFKFVHSLPPSISLIATSREENRYEDGGGLGKFRKRPLRKTHPTPYDRPPTALRNPNQNKSWLSKFVDPAQRLITYRKASGPQNKSQSHELHTLLNSSIAASQMEILNRTRPLLTNSQSTNTILKTNSTFPFLNHEHEPTPPLSLPQNSAFGNPIYNENWRNPLPKPPSSYSNAVPHFGLVTPAPLSNTYDSHALLNMFGDLMSSQQWHDIKELFEAWVRSLDKDGKPNKPDVNLFNHYLKANLMMGASAINLLDLLAQMEHFSVEPNTVSFNLVLKAGETLAGETLPVEKLLEQMLQSGNEALPDDESYDLVHGRIFSTDQIDPNDQSANDFLQESNNEGDDNDNEAKTLVSESDSALVEMFPVVEPMEFDDGKSVVYDFTSLLKLCGENLDYIKGREINGMLTVNGFASKALWLVLDTTRKDYTILGKTERGKFDILFMTPEKVCSIPTSFWSHLLKEGIILFTSDEAHCISEWGHDFRVEYKQLNKLPGVLLDVPYVGLTATATEKVWFDITNSLKMNNLYIVVGSFDRPNLFYGVKKFNQGPYFIDELVEEISKEVANGCSTISYCTTIKGVEQIYESFMDMFRKTLGGMFDKLPGSVRNTIEGTMNKKITSDPCVSISISNAVIGRTFVISNSENPVWSKHFYVSVAHNAAEVLFVVKDNDVVGSQLISTVAFLVEPIYSEEQVFVSVPLSSDYLGAANMPSSSPAASITDANVAATTLIRLPSSKVPKGRNLIGDHVAYDVDVRLPDERRKRARHEVKPDDSSYHKGAHYGHHMLISAGDDIKLYAYTVK